MVYELHFTITWSFPEYFLLLFVWNYIPFPYIFVAATKKFES